MPPTQIIRWRKGQKGLDVLSYTFKGHIDHSSKYSHIIIHNVTTEMLGRYTCNMKTDLNVQETDYNLIVITQAACKLNDWHIKSDRSKCTEIFQFDCRHMFPRPSPSCGLWDERAGKFIAAVPVLISEEPNSRDNNTWRVRYVEKYELLLAAAAANSSMSKIQKASLDLFQYAGNLFLRCDIVVPETSWKLSFKYKMFDFSDGCQRDPLETIERMRSNYSQYAASRMKQAGYLLESRKTEANNGIEMLTSSLKYEIWPPPSNKHDPLDCWRKPRIGSLAYLSCASKGAVGPGKQVKFVGADLLECTKDGWLPLKSRAAAPVAQSAANMQRAHVHQRKQQSAVAAANAMRQQDLSSKQQQHTATITREKSTNESSNIADSLTKDNDDDNDDSANTLPPNTTAEQHAKSSNLIPTQEILSFGAQSSAALIERRSAAESSWTPAQLAALLPRCIAIDTTRRRQNKPSAGKRLPLVDHKLSSSETGKKFHGDDEQPATNQLEDEDEGVGLLPSSSSAASTEANSRCLAATFAFLTIIWFLTRLDLSIERAFVREQHSQTLSESD